MDRTGGGLRNGSEARQATSGQGARARVLPSNSPSKLPGNSSNVAAYPSKSCRSGLTGASKGALKQGHLPRWQFWRKFTRSRCALSRGELARATESDLCPAPPRAQFLASRRLDLADGGGGDDGVSVPALAGSRQRSPLVAGWVQMVVREASATTRLRRQGVAPV